MKKIVLFVVLSFTVLGVQAGDWSDALDPRDYDCADVQTYVQEKGKARFCSGLWGCRKVVADFSIYDSHKYSPIVWPTRNKMFCKVGYAKTSK